MQTRKSFIRIMSIVLSMVLVFAAFAVLVGCPPPLTEYTIEYNLDGGTNHADNPATYTTNNFPLVIKEPTKEGFTFEGWTSEINSEKKTSLTIYLGQEQNLKLVAHWLGNSAPGNISYRLEGGTNHGDNPLIFTEEDLPLTISKQPTREGYIFKGWTVADSTEKKMTVTIESFDFVVLTAHWTAGEPADYGNGKKLAPDFTLKDLDGNDLKLSQFRGEKAVMITFFSHDCPNCKKDIEDIILPNKDAFGDDVEFLLVHSAHEKDGGNGTAKLHTLLDEKKEDGFDYRQLKIVLDPDFLVIVGLYGSATVPNTFMVDKWGYLFKEDRDASNTVVAFSHSRVSKFGDFSRIINGAITRGMGN